MTRTVVASVGMTGVPIFNVKQQLLDRPETVDARASPAGKPGTTSLSGHGTIATTGVFSVFVCPFATSPCWRRIRLHYRS